MVIAEYAPKGSRGAVGSSAGVDGSATKNRGGSRQERAPPGGTDHASANGAENGPSSSSGSGSASRVIKTVRFRRGRAAKACEVCHARKVRCDMTEKFPCTNCRAFSLVCVPRTGRTKGKSEIRVSDSDPATLDPAVGSPVATTTTTASDAEAADGAPQSAASAAKSAGVASALHDEALSAVAMTPDGTSRAISALKSSATIDHQIQKREPSRFIGTLRDSISTGGELPEDGLLAQILKTRFKVISLPHYDADIIASRATGCFLLPTPEISDHLVEQYFRFVHPIVPVVDRVEFLRQYREDRDKPPLLLRHAMFCIATKQSGHPGLLDEHASPRKAAYAFYRRAKMLIDIGFEENVETCICASIILSLAIENPLFMNQNGYYWVRVALAQAQGARMHRRLRGHEYSPDKRRRYRRIWWTLYKRDVATAVAFGAPLAINLDDCDVEMVKPDDFIDSEGPNVEPGSETDIHINFFIQSVRLHEILALIIRVQLSVGAERLRREHVVPDITQCDRALAEWVNQLPAVLTYSIKDQRRHDFIRALLYLEYYTVVCLSHRPQVSHLYKLNGWEDFPTWSIAFQAAHMICKILENMGSHAELRLLPGSAVYSCFSALVMMSIQRRILRGRHDAVSDAVDQSLKSFVDICREVGKTHTTGVWVMQLAIDLQSDEVAAKLAKSLQKPDKAKRQRHDHHTPKPRAPSVGIVLATDPADSGYDSSSPHSQMSQVSPTGPYTPVSASPSNATAAVPGDHRQNLAVNGFPEDRKPLDEQDDEDNTQDVRNSGSNADPGIDLGFGDQGDSSTRVSFVKSESADPASPIKRSESVAAIDFFPQEPLAGDFFVDQKTNMALNSSTGDDLVESMNMVDWYDFLSAGPTLDSNMGPWL